MLGCRRKPRRDAAVHREVRRVQDRGERKDGMKRKASAER